MSAILFYCYCFFLLLFIVGAIFTLYHLLRYSLDKTVGFMGALFFSIVFCFLLVSNVSAFRALELEELFKSVGTDTFMPKSQFAPPVNSRSSNPW